MALRLKELTREIESLRRQLLPATFAPTGDYAEPNRVQVHTRAFLVLSHAELETYFEGWAKDIARAAEDLWANTKRISTPLAFLLSTIGKDMQLVDALGTKGDSHKRFGDVVTAVFPQFYARIKENHGIKEKNVLALFDPLGVSSLAFVSTLFPRLDSMGTKRGEHAHHSRRAVTSTLDPEYEYKDVLGVVADLKTFEDWLVAYKQKVR